jgi:polyphenol oxidase
METIIVTTNGDLANEDKFELRSGDGTTWLACLPLEAEGFMAVFSTRDGATDGEQTSDTTKRLLAAIGQTNATLVTCRQVHSASVRVVRSRDEAHGQATECDALTTSQPGVLLGIKTADCVPILIADLKTRAVAAVHAGWRGSAARIVERAFATMIASWKTHRDDCVAVVGPCVCGSCYEVGPEVVERFLSEFPYGAQLIADQHEGKGYLDLKLANVIQLENCGLPRERIFVTELCTICDNDLFFSYRKEGSRAGRVLSVIGS